MKEFWTAYGLGMLSVVPGIAFGMVGGPVLGLVAGVCCAAGALSLGRVCVVRAGGVVLGAATPFVVGLAALVALLSTMDI